MFLILLLNVFDKKKKDGEKISKTKNKTPEHSEHHNQKVEDICRHQDLT